MSFIVHDHEFHDIIPEGSQLEAVTGGFVFTEGPIWHPTEHWLMFSDIITSTQYKWSEADGLSVVRTPSNMSNGNFFDTVGRVVSCEHATSRVVRWDYENRVLTTLASHYEGQELNSPNDIVVDTLGRIWFTDPTFGRIREDVGYIRDVILDHRGVYRIDPDGTLTCVSKDFEQPNGLCLSNDEKQLFVNDSKDPCIKRFDINEDGSLSDATVWARVKGDEPKERQWVPDGMKVTNGGALLCNGPGGVHVYNDMAKCLGVISMPEKSTNFCFGGENRDWLYITASTHLYRIKTATNGAPMIPGSN